MKTSRSAESIFFATIEKTSPVERAAYLDEACLGDSDLRRQVERLLEAHSQVGSFLEKPLGDSPADEAFHSGEHPTAVDPNPLPDLGGESKSHITDSSQAGPVPDFLTPSQKPGVLGRLDHYEILEIVGSGGMGVVLKGFDEKLHRVVAIKVLAAELAVSGTARQRFTREARAAAAVSHEHVVTIHAVEEEHRPPYLVMEFVDGVSLQAKLDKEGRLGLNEILRIGLQTAEGLAAAHRQGLVHRDIKPANILLEDSIERVKLTDFGLARAVDDASLTQSGVIAGTPMYMSPEQADGEPIDHRSDLFSLGSVLYTMCTGRPPFRADGTHAVLKRVMEDTPRPIQEVNQEIPGWLCDLIARLHAKKPDARFQSAKEVADLLGQQLAYLQQPGQIAMPRLSQNITSCGSLQNRRRVGPVAYCFLLLVLGGGLFMAYQAGWLGRSPKPSDYPQAEPKPGLAKDESDQGKAQPIAQNKPVSKEVLEELRRLEKVQEMNLEQVQTMFKAERITSKELCAAEDLLIEVRIKLAIAEQRPVTALLKDLVRNCEEELRVTQARVEEGAEAETELLSAKARLSEARTRLAAAQAEAPETRP
jgi:serine/threonine protein kinase